MSEPLPPMRSGEPPTPPEPTGTPSWPRQSKWPVNMWTLRRRNRKFRRLQRKNRKRGERTQWTCY
jgi:hypothetical protein